MAHVRDWLAPLIHLSSNWLSFTGVALATTGGILWLALLPHLLRGAPSNPYLGILTFLLLPAIFFLGLILIPAGLLLRRHGERRRGAYPGSFPDAGWSNIKFRRLVIFVGALTCANLVIATQLSYQAVHYMESIGFCGQTCHVMQPEAKAHAAAPHARVPCVACHVGEGAAAFARAKLSGVRQVFQLGTGSYERPIPAPVHDMRPAEATCGGCHRPDRSMTDRLKVIEKYSDEEKTSAARTVLLMRVDRIHRAHRDDGLTIRYMPSDAKRSRISWIEYTKNGKRRIFSEPGAGEPGGAEMRTMDCLDCHNRPAHPFETPERAVDRVLASGALPRDIPYVRKRAVETLKRAYSDRLEAASAIRSEFGGRGGVLLGIWSRNVFPHMKVAWGTYPTHLGHTDSPGCYRCHDDNHADASGKKIGQDCNSCHNLLAMEEAQPKILGDLGFPEAGK